MRPPMGQVDWSHVELEWVLHLAGEDGEAGLAQKFRGRIYS